MKAIRSQGTTKHKKNSAASSKTSRAEALPRIAVFAGPSATVLNSIPPRTSRKAREKHGLPPLRDWFNRPVIQDQLTWQRLAAPVTVYVEQFSANPLEKDSAELFAPPDGYLDAKNVFHPVRINPADRPVYQVELRPEDGLYPFPYMARRADGSAWEDWQPHTDTEVLIRQTFYPDAARLFEEIARMGAETTGNIFARARFSFFRPAPPAGYVHGLSAAQRTDEGSGDIPEEKAGVDYFPYTYRGSSPAQRFNPTRAQLAGITNQVQSTLVGGTYQGAFWMEGSPRIEDTMYWLGLVIDTDAMLVGIAANRPNRMLSADGPWTIVDAVDLVLSDIWRDANGSNRIGATVVQDQKITTAREAVKGSATPGGFDVLGGHGGVIGSTYGPRLTFLPTRCHTRNSAVRYSTIPREVSGIHRVASGPIERVQVVVKDEAGQLLGEAIPIVEIIEFNSWMTANPPGTPDPVIARVESAMTRCLGEAPLCGIVFEAPTGGHLDRRDAQMIDQVAMSGFVVVKVWHGTPQMFVNSDSHSLFLAGNNLSANKARILLMACLLRFGCPPPASDPAHPTAAELTAVKSHLVLLQEVFDTH